MSTVHPAIIIAPTGEPMHWTRADTAERAILNFLPTLLHWNFARAQGYRIRFFERKRGRPEKE